MKQKRKLNRFQIIITAPHAHVNHFLEPVQSFFKFFLPSRISRACFPSLPATRKRLQPLFTPFPNQLAVSETSPTLSIEFDIRLFHGCQPLLDGVVDRLQVGLKPISGIDQFDNNG